MSSLRAGKRPENFDVDKFNEYLLNIRIEVEILKVRTSQRNNGVQKHLSKIDEAISGITDMLLEYAKKSGRREIYLNNTVQDKKALVGLAIKRALLEIREST